MNGSRTPTAKKRLAAAIPIWPVAGSRAMIDQVIVGNPIAYRPAA
jgi:hypothetical protein